MTVTHDKLERYKVGGSLAFNHPSYAQRKADRELLEALIEDKFCYVFNCRQMGKSSLRVRTMHQLQAKGMSCASVDITSLGSDISQSQWYGGLITQLFLGFNLVGKINLKLWLKKRESLSPLQKFREFIEDIILEYCLGEKVYIFIDEIDKVLSLSFSLDDFFTLIRYFYNQRAENEQYKKLSFALFGVATPSDLIRDKTQTPFNIGQAIELTGFTLAEATPLTDGLYSITQHPQDLLKAILDWTGGQPFLTQKVCQLLLNHCSNISSEQVQDCVAEIITEKIIINWESQDEPVHLKTIRDRLFRNEQRSGRLLGIYQNILQKESIEADNSPEQAELRLSGLVVKQNGKLTVYNKIYQSVFNLQWVNKELEKIRPYSESITAWIQSNYQDNSRLLRGKALKDALDWTKDKSLSSIDYQFLSASQNFDKQEAIRSLEAQKQANEVLTKANHKANRMMRIGAGFLAISILGSAIGFQQTQQAYQKQQEAQKGTEIQRIGNSAWRQFEFDQIGALLSAMQAGQDLKTLVNSTRSLESYPATSPILALQFILEEIQEKNWIEGHEEAVTSVSISPDAKFIATASRDGTAKLWNRQGEEIATLNGHQDSLYDIEFSPDGKVLATTSGDKMAKLWNLEGKNIATLNGHQDTVIRVSFSPDGKYATTTSSDKTARIWNLQGETVAILQRHERSVDDVVFSPDGQEIATASRDSTVRLWTLTGKLLTIFSNNGISVYSVAISPDGNLIAGAAKDGSVTVWNRQGQRVMTLSGHQGFVNRVIFNQAGNRIFTASSDGTARLWDEKGNLITILPVSQEPVTDVAINSQGTWVATASTDGIVKLWDLSPKLNQGFNAYSPHTSAVTLDPQHQQLAIASETGVVSIWNLQGQQQGEFKTSQGWIYGICFSPDGKSVAVASGSGETKLWDLKGNLLAEFADNGARVYDVAFSQDGTKLAIASKDGFLDLWDLTQPSPRRLRRFKAHEESIFSVNFSPDGQFLATASKDKTGKIWDLSGQLQATLTGHQDILTQIRFRQDGQWLLTASRDGTAKLWDNQGNLKYTLTEDPFPVTAISFSENDPYIATASVDGTARLWDFQGNLRGEFKDEQKGIYGIDFSRDGQQIIAVGGEGMVRFWQVEREFARLERLLTQGCTWLDDYLTTRPQKQEILSVCQDAVNN